MWYADSMGGPGTNAFPLSDYLGSFPSAKIVNDNSQNIGGIRIASGFSSVGYDFNTNVDNFTIGVTLDNTTITTYDFDPSPSPVPEPMDFVGLSSLAGMALLGLVWRMRGAKAAH